MALVVVAQDGEDAEELDVEPHDGDDESEGPRPRVAGGQPARGDVLVFVESQSGRMVSNIGVVEDVLVSGDPIEVLRFAGSRTVYTPPRSIKCARMGRRT